MFPSSNLLIRVGVAWGLTLSIPALAQVPPARPSRDLIKAVSASETDVQTLLRLTQASMKALEASKVAGAASRKETRDYAQEVLESHGKVADELKTLAARKNIQAPTLLDEGLRKVVEALAKEPGIDLDRVYLTMMVDDHQDMITMYEAIIDKAQDDEIRTWAVNTLPTIRAQHLAATDVRARLDQLSRR